VKKELLLYSGPFGLALWFFGSIFIERASSDKGRQIVNEAGKRAKESGTNLWVSASTSSSALGNLGKTSSNRIFHTKHHKKCYA
jgi:1-acyl-sn-glycerol-3-phosphate acyltransferase